MGLRIRFFIEIGLAGAFGGLALLTLVWPNWIEAAFGFNLDGGLGGLEQLIVAAVGVAAGACVLLARSEWRRGRPMTMTR